MRHTTTMCDNKVYTESKRNPMVLYTLGHRYSWHYNISVLLPEGCFSLYFFIMNILLSSKLLQISLTSIFILSDTVMISIPPSVKFLSIQWKMALVSKVLGAIVTL